MIRYLFFLVGLAWAEKQLVNHGIKIKIFVISWLIYYLTMGRSYVVINLTHFPAALHSW